MEWPRATHEVPLTDLKEAMNPIVQKFPFDRRILRATFESNFTFKSSQTGFSATPDLSLILMSLKRKSSRCKDFQVLAIVECAFSQNRKELESKIRKELAARPEMVLVIMILVNENEDYRCPEEGSLAWVKFSRDLECRDAPSFFHSDDESSTTDSATDSESDELGGSGREESFILQPVVIAEHQWCNITSVEYCVWVKNDDDPIDIDNDRVTYGVGGYIFFNCYL